MMKMIQPERQEMGKYFAIHCWLLVVIGYLALRYFMDNTHSFVGFLIFAAYFAFRLFTTPTRDLFEVKVDLNRITVGGRKWSVLLIPSQRQELTGEIDFSSQFFYGRYSLKSSAKHTLRLRKSTGEEIKLDVNHVPSFEQANEEIQEVMNSSLLEKGKQILSDSDQVIDCGVIGLSRDCLWVEGASYSWNEVEIVFQESFYMKDLMEIKFLNQDQKPKSFPLEELANTKLTLNLLKWKLGLDAKK